ncbi:MAG: alpha/beta hydrolase-fold protein [Acholeplasmataceae bacterium]|nr:alpha/beta hydrolase-fold protein [Acholeplasmataceae bacterium]
MIGNLDIVTIEDDRFPNTSQQSRKLRIWTPENYDPMDLEKKYPVIYMHDAQNLFDKNTSFAGEWEVDETITELMENYSFEGVIIVGIDNSPERMGEYVYDHEFLTGALGATKTGNYYMAFLVDIVKPYIDENYNTKQDRLNTYISGSSLGGLISIFGGLEYLEIFGGILAFSTSTQLVNSEELPQYFASLDLDLLKETHYFFYVGTNGDGNVNWPGHYKELLVDLNVPESNIQVLIGENHQHNELAWRTFFPEAISWIFDLN